MVQPVADGTLVSEWREWEQRSGGTLAFRQAPWNTWAIRVTYTTSPSVDWADYTATVPSDVPVEFMTWYAIHAAARAVTGRVGYDDSAAQRLADFALEMAERQRPLMAATWPKESVRIWTPTNTPSITLP
jgi:hypothetical protein